MVQLGGHVDDSVHASAEPYDDRDQGFPLDGAAQGDAAIGSIIGTGVFALPSALAPYGPISLVAFVAVTVGALALAVTFGALSKRVPAAEASP